MTETLHTHQELAIGLLRASLRAGKKRPMLQAPTGAGKTKIAASIIRMAREKGRRVMFTVPSITLIDQTVEAFGAEGIDGIGVCQADHPLTNWLAPVQVASVQTLGKRTMPSTDLVVVDEAHQSFAVIFKLMAEHPTIPFIGLSATPWTRGLGKHYDDLIVAATTRELIDKGLLSPFRVFAPTHPDLSKVHTIAGDYHEGELADVMDKPELTADVVSTWLKLGENRPTLCFAVNRAHARSLEQQFERAGVSTAYVDAHTDRAERGTIGEAFNAGRVKVVVNVGCLTTGVDWDVRCLVLARPTKSEMLFVQIIGRALRTAPGKVDALILDHSDTTLKLGFVDTIHHDTLDDGRPVERVSVQRKAKEALPKECPAADCHYVKPAGVRKCPACGFEPVFRQDVEVIDGELTQLKGVKGKAADRATKQKFWSGLLWYVDNRGKKEGWASHKYKERFGVWPNGLRAIVMEPDINCRNFVKASAIRYAKLQEKRKLETANA